MEDATRTTERETGQPGVSHLAEFIASWMIVFAWVALTVGDLNTQGKIGPAGKALGIGTIVAAASIGSLRKSPGLANPAVVIALAGIGRLRVKRVVTLIAVQLAGAVFGAATARGFFATGALYLARGGTPIWNDRNNIYQATVAEFAFAFALLWCLLSTTRPKRTPAENPNEIWSSPNLTGAVAGLCAVAFCLTGSSISGGMANPLIAFGPATVSMFWDSQFAYWAGPVLGAFFSTVLYNVWYRHG